MAKVMIFALIIVFLQVRPGGLFPQKGRAAET
jgi:urea transport system permease protein